MSRRALWLTGLLVALLLAGVGSYYASSSPDGLERVAESAGFADTAEESPASESPLADYSTEGVGDERISGGLAGVVGALAVLLLAGGLAYAVRRRGTDTRAPGTRAAEEPAESAQIPASERDEADTRADSAHEKR